MEGGGGGRCKLFRIPWQTEWYAFLAAVVRRLVGRREYSRFVYMCSIDLHQAARISSRTCICSAGCTVTLSPPPHPLRSAFESNNQRVRAAPDTMHAYFMRFSPNNVHLLLPMLAERRAACAHTRAHKDLAFPQMHLIMLSAFHLCRNGIQFRYRFRKINNLPECNQAQTKCAHTHTRTCTTAHARFRWPTR